MGRRLTVFWDIGELGSSVIVFICSVVLSFPMCPIDSMPNSASCSYKITCHSNDFLSFLIERLKFNNFAKLFLDKLRNAKLIRGRLVLFQDPKLC